MSFASGLKTIVVATDLDGRAEAALEYARKLAVAYGSRIVLAHGLDPVDYASVAAVPGKVLSSLTEQARAILDQMAADLVLEGIHSHSEIRQGEVAQMLVEVVRKYEAGLLVIGTEGKEGAGPILVGSVAEQLVRLCPCPVLAVAADYNAGAFRPLPGGPVMLAMERNDATAEAVATASSLAEVFHRTLIGVHARRPEEAVAFLNPVATTREQFGIESEGRRDRDHRRFPLRQQRLHVCELRLDDAVIALILEPMPAQHDPSLHVGRAAERQYGDDLALEIGEILDRPVLQHEKAAAILMAVDAVLDLVADDPQIVEMRILDRRADGRIREAGEIELIGGEGGEPNGRRGEMRRIERVADALMGREIGLHHHQGDA